jgi:hypothetical protein
VVGHGEVTLEVDVDDDVPLVLGHREAHAVAQDPGVVDHDVDPAEPLDRKPHERRSPGPARDVVGVGGGAAPAARISSTTC